MAVIIQNNPSFPPPTAPGIAPPLWAFVLLIVRLIQLIFIGLYQGPSRPNRSRVSEVMIRTARALFSGTGLNVHQVRFLWQLGNRISGSDPNAHPLVQNCTIEVLCFDAVLVDNDTTNTTLSMNLSNHYISGKFTKVRTSLHAQYPSKVALDSVWKVHGEWIIPNDMTTSTRDGVMLFIHGGGFVFGSSSGFRPRLVPLAKKFKRRIFSLDYRLSPESQFPVAIHEAVAAYSYLINHYHVLPKSIMLMGDSAGGNLAMAMLLFLRDHAYPLPGGAVLISPYADLCGDLPSVTDNSDLDLIRVDKNNPYLSLAKLYVGDEDCNTLIQTDYLVSPVLAKNLSPPRPLPPIYISTGRDEVFFDDNVLLACNLVHHHISPIVIHDIFEHQYHEFQFGLPDSKDTILYWDRVETFMHQYVDVEQKLEPAQGVEVSLIRDGIIKYRGLQHTWLPRWKGIQMVKKMDWDLGEEEDQHCILLLPS